MLKQGKFLTGFSEIYVHKEEADALEAIDKKLRQEFKKTPRKNTAVQTLKQKVERQLQRMVRQNPARINLYERLQAIVEEYNRETDRVTIEETFAKLLDLVETIDEEQNRYVREGFDNEKQLMAYDLIRQHKNNLSPAKLEHVKDLSRKLIAKIKDAIAEIDNWREKETTQAAVHNVIHDTLFDEETGLPYPEFDRDDIDALTEDFFREVFRQYPSTRTASSIQQV